MRTQSDPRTNIDPVANRRALTLRHIEHVRAGSTDPHPDGARVAPAGEYLDPELATAERLLLRSLPLVAGIQRSMSSGLRDILLIGANEPSVTEIHRGLARAMGRPDPDRPLDTTRPTTPPG